MQLIAMVGCGRSGSTLIEGLLQDHFDICSLGEVSYIWERGRLKDELCGCGKPFSQCDYWQPVLKDAFGEVSEADARHFDAAFSTARGKVLEIPLTMGKMPAADPLFADVAKALYRSAHKIGGGRPLIDSSKVPRFAASLQAAGVAAVGALHVFRDACGNVYSLRTPKSRPQANSTGDAQIGRSKSVLHAIARWKLRNLQSQKFLSHADGPTAIICYEAFCRDPEPHLSHIAQTFGFHTRQRNSPALWHSVSGNPMRFSNDKLDIRLDERWRTSMSAFDKAITRLLSSAQQSRMVGAAFHGV